MVGRVCHSEGFGASTSLGVFRHQTKEEKYALKNVRGKSRDGDVYQMIWGCFAGNKLGPIVSIAGSVTGDVYTTILHDNLLPYLDALANDGIIGITLQQDNARSHTCKKAKAFFNSAMAEHGFTVMDDWPPYSPDMNLIKNLWAHLKLELHQRYPDTATLCGSCQYIHAAALLNGYTKFGGQLERRCWKV